MLMTAVVTLALGLFHGRLARWGERRRALRISGEDLYFGGRPFRAFRARLRDLAAFELDPSRAVIRTRSGRVRRLDLADLDNADEVRRALEQLRTQIVRRPPDAAEPTPPSRR